MEPMQNPTCSATTNVKLLRKFSLFNIRGLCPSSVPSKVPYISDLLYEKDQLLMALTETWLKDHKDDELHIEGYQLFRSDRKRAKKSTRGRLSGGVAAYIHKDLADETTVKLQFSNGTVEVLGLHSALENIYIAVIYRQPNYSVYFYYFTTFWVIDL